MPTKRPYHHGNLKPELIKAAVVLIGEVGPAAFTLREVARRAGISHNAPYRHFHEKDGLLAAVATEGFERLVEALVAPVPKLHARNPRPARQRLKAYGLGYVLFAVRFPEHLMVMFDWHLEPERYPELAGASGRAFSLLVSLVEAAQTEGSLSKAGPLTLAYSAWSLVHGIAKLAISRCFPFSSESEILAFAGKAIDALLDGLGPKPAKRV